MRLLRSRARCRAGGSWDGARLPVRLGVWLALLFLWSFPRTAADAGETWPEFRGPSADGHADTSELPIHWSESQNIRWKVAIHDKGWSSPVIWGNQIWMTTATEDGKALFVICVDRASGKVVHDRKLFDVDNPGFCPPTNSYASPTPVIEEGRVYVHFGSYGTACLDTTTGRTLWSRRDLPCNHWRGPGSSPILYENLLFLTFDGYDQQYVAALDKRTGQTAWRRARDIRYGTTNNDLKKAFSTPAIIRVNGKTELVSPSAAATIAYDPQTGREIWKLYHGGMNVSARPVYGLGLVFVTTGEYSPFRLVAIRPDGEGDVTRTHVAWKQNRGVPARPSLLLVGDLLFMVNESGVVTCMQASDGQVLWQKRIGGEHFASPVYAAGNIYFFDAKNASHVMKAGREPVLVARNQLNDGCMASPAIAGNALYVRTRTHLYCIEKDHQAGAQFKISAPPAAGR